MSKFLKGTGLLILTSIVVLFMFVARFVKPKGKKRMSDIETLKADLEAIKNDPASPESLKQFAADLVAVEDAQAEKISKLEAASAPAPEPTPDPLPPVEEPPVVEPTPDPLPPVDPAPPVEEPPVETPPVETPPVVEEPPVETPPVEPEPQPEPQPEPPIDEHMKALMDLAKAFAAGLDALGQEEGFSCSIPTDKGAWEFHGTFVKS